MAASKYYLEMNGRNYSITTDYLIDKLANGNAVEMTPDMEVNLESENEAVVFLKKVYPGFSIERRIIRPDYVSNLIATTMDESYIENFESLIVTQRSHWLSIIFLFYVGQVTTAFINDFIEETSLYKRSLLLISELNECLATTDLINPFDSWFNNLKDIVGDLKTNDLDDFFYSDYVGNTESGADRTRMNRTPRCTIFKSKVLENQRAGLQKISFAEYVVYERFFATTASFWQKLGMSFSWMGLKSSSDQYVKSWDHEIGFWEGLWYIVARIVFLVTMIAALFVPVFGWTVPVLGASMLTAFASRQFTRATLGYNAFVKSLAGFAAPLQSQKQVYRKFKFGDYLTQFSTNYFVEMATRTFIGKEINNGPYDIVSNMDEAIARSRGMMLSMDGFYTSGTSANMLPFGISGETFNNKNNLAGSCVKNVRNQLFSQWAEILPNATFGQDATSSENKFVTQIVDSIINSSEIIPQREVPQRAYCNPPSAVTNMIHNMSDNKILLKKLNTCDNKGLTATDARSQLFCNIERLKVLQGTISNINRSRPEYGFNTMQFFDSKNPAKEISKYIKFMKTELKGLLQDKKKQVTNLNDEIYWSIFIDTIDQYCNFLQNNNNRNTIMTSFTISQNILKSYRFQRTIYRLFMEIDNFYNIAYYASSQSNYEYTLRDMMSQLNLRE